MYIILLFNVESSVLSTQHKEALLTNFYVYLYQRQIITLVFMHLISCIRYNLLYH